VVLCAGCGLEDYEKQMAVEQKWAEKFDQITGKEKEFLDSPLDMPPKITRVRKDAKGKEETYKVYPIPELFLRPPAGISAKPGNPLGGLTPPLYPYLGDREGYRLLVTGTKDSKLRQSEFQEQVCKNVGLSNPKFQRVQMESLGETPREFSRTVQVIGKTSYVIYFAQDGNTQLAFVFMVPKDRATDTNKAIEASLGTLETGDRASDVGRAFNSSDKSEYYRLRISAK
jgi:hypothetical protein